jgi:hypothetical protein
MIAGVRWALVLLAMACACAREAPTGIVVEVSSDLAVPAEIDSLRLRVLDAQGSLLSDRILPAGAASGRLGLMPRDPGRDTRVTVEASALLQGRERVVRKATVAFQRGRVLLLSLELHATCACRNCGSDTCVAGHCVPVWQDASTLPLYRPGAQHEEVAGIEVAPRCDRDAEPPALEGGASDADTDGGADDALPPDDADTDSEAAD